MLNNLTCESLIYFLASTKPIDDLPWPKLESSDYSLINSLSKQLSKGMGFTDRQHELAKQKIDFYADAFIGIDIEQVKNNLELPLREIDRARWIDLKEMDKEIFIQIRFIFQKKLISALEDFKRHLKESDCNYDKVDKIHSVRYSEQNLYNIVNAFKDKNFVLSEQVQTIYAKLEEMKKENYIPGVYNYEIKNLPVKGAELLTEEVGPVSEDNLFLYKERSLRYGLGHFDDDALNRSLVTLRPLTKNIVKRKSRSIAVYREECNIDDLVLSLETLKRFPLLIMLPSSEAHDTLVTLHRDIKNIIPSKDVSVMFRMNNDDSKGAELNEYIKKENINNRLAKNTKIVYTLDNKIPKPLFHSGIEVMAIMVYSSSSGFHTVRKSLSCFDNKDLIIHYNTKNSSASRYIVDRSIEQIHAYV